MRIRGITAALAISAAAAACGPSSPPSADELQSQLAVDLPAYWRTAAFTVDGEQLQNGADVPYRARFRADVQLLAPMYVEDQRMGDTVIVRIAARAGDRRTVYGRVESRVARRGWKSTLRLDADPTKQAGVPREAIQARRVIVAGTPDEHVFWAARQRAEMQAEEARMQAERAALLESLVGEWQGTVFDRDGGRLYITGAGEQLAATLLHQGYREELSVTVGDDGSLSLSGYAVTKQNGRAADNYYLDSFTLSLSDDGRMLHGAGVDQGGQSGGVRLVRIGG